MKKAYNYIKSILKKWFYTEPAKQQAEPQKHELSRHRIDVLSSQSKINTATSLMWGVRYFPILLNIKNVSDKKIENISVFNFDYKSQKDIVYECAVNVDYDYLLRVVSSINTYSNRIGIVRLLGKVMDDQSFGKRVEDMIVSFKSRTLDGYIVEIPKKCFLDPMQNLTSVIDIKLDFSFPFCNSSEITLSHINPKDEINIVLYVEK